MCAARRVLFSKDKSSLKREREIRSSVRYQVCLLRTVRVLLDTPVLIFLYLARLLQNRRSFCAAEESPEAVNHGLR